MQFQAEDYEIYSEYDFKHRWLRPHVLNEKLNKYRSLACFSFVEFGRSEENRELSYIEYGTGPVKIMLWTQMHGNESTASMALVDILNFFIGKGEKYRVFRDEIMANFTIRMIPMLNPDGAERFTRRNAVQIDMNRDAVKQESMEMKAFFKLFEDFKPDWAFNLHDQRNFFSVGSSDKTATISFLAASSDEERNINPVREKSMKLISGMIPALNSFIPAHIAKYTDEFYPTALGEFFHTKETPCILIESGAYPNDPFRNMARKANFLLLLRAFHILIKDDVQSYSMDVYKAIPENGKSIRDLIIRDCKMSYEEKTIVVDLGFTLIETPDFKSGNLKRSFKLTDLGDLRYLYGMEERKNGIIEDHVIPEPDKLAHFTILLNNGEKMVFDEGFLS